MSEASEENPAIAGALWKALSVLGVPALAIGAGLWRDVAIHSNDIAQLRAEVAANQSAIRDHLTSDRSRLDAEADAAKNLAVDRARLGAAFDVLKGQIDALTTALYRRRPG